MIPRSHAKRVRVRGIVQGVGFRPYVYRLAREHDVSGWIANVDEGVEIHIEGGPAALDDFLHDLSAKAPPASTVASVVINEAPVAACRNFEIRASESHSTPTTRISPDLPVCDACLADMRQPGRRFAYPYINCTDCGPRFSIVRSLPYDRACTTMAEWTMCPACRAEYEDPLNRRFHAQPIACKACGPHYALVTVDEPAKPPIEGDLRAVTEAVRRLRRGHIVALKGIGGYHLACDAGNRTAVERLRTRKYRKEQAFAIMARDLDVARHTCALDQNAEAALQALARPIVIAPARIDLPGVAPECTELGVMLPYAPVHYLMFAAGAPDRLVMTSGNRSSEPTIFRDADAFERLADLADAVLVGERPIARRVDDSVMRAGVLGPIVIRRSRGLAPGVVASLPVAGPVLAMGGDLKNAITLVVNGEACVSQHIGDLEHQDARLALREVIDDFIAMYHLRWPEVLVVHDAHPQYISTAEAERLPSMGRLAIQHHRAHVASVLAERGELDHRVVGIALDGTGFGDDGSIWGGEFFVGSVSRGLDRVASLAPAMLAGGDAAARHPVQAAAGFLAALDAVPDLHARPFAFPDRFRLAQHLIQRGVRTVPTTSTGRLFDAVAALTGFTRAITFEGQAGMWLEHLARGSSTTTAYAMPFDGQRLDWRPALDSILRDRVAARDPSDIARAFHRGLARGLADAVLALLARYGLDTVVLSGGVIQNSVLVSDFVEQLDDHHVRIWINQRVPPNDGGLSLGQAALAVASNGGAS